MKLDTAKIKLLMAQRGMSLGQFAKNAGVSQQTISTIKNRKTCTTVTAFKLAKGLNIDVTEIVEENA